MGRVQKLKVFRTPIGFHDAYVAAPSQKAALEAWGADSNLFASGSAEQVDDPELMQDALASPGQVVRRVRGTLAEHFAALPKKPANRGSKPGPTSAFVTTTSKSAGKPRRQAPKRRPSRTALDRAEIALAYLNAEHAEAMKDIARRQAQLDHLRRTLEARQERERKKRLDRISAARDKFERAMQAWRDD